MEHALTTGSIPAPDSGPDPATAQTPETAVRTAILVSGMHRSGTSALTRVISLLGAQLPTHLIEGKPGDNERGFWEGRAMVDLDELVLDVSGSWWCGWQQLHTDDLPGRSLVVMRAREILRDQLGDADLVVLKDPRLSRTMPLWVEALEAEGYTCVHVVAVRDPAEVAASVLRRNRLEAPVTELAWLAHVLDAEHHTRGAPRVFVSFDHLMGGWRHEARRIGHHLGVEWPRSLDDVAPEVEEFIEPALRHSVGMPVTAARPLHDLFLRWCVDDVRPEDEDEIEGWRNLLAPVRAGVSPTAHAARGDDAVLTQQRIAAAERRPWRGVDREAFNAEAAAAHGWLTARLEADRVTNAAAHVEIDAAAALAETEERASKALHMVSGQATARIAELRERAAVAAQRRDEALDQLRTARERAQGLREQLQTARSRAKGLREQLQTARGNAAIGRRARALVYDLLVEQVAATRGRPWTAVRRQAAIERLETSGLFDAEDYLVRYPDAASSGLTPSEHFLVEGRARGHYANPVRDHAGREQQQEKEVDAR